MFPLLGGLITGGAGLLGSIFSSQSSAANNAANVQMQLQNNAANIAMQRETNQMSVAEAQKNRDFQEQMSNTAFQRASTDMTAAGLNPAAMFGSGGPASTPGGGQPGLVAPRGEAPQNRENPGRAFESLGASAGQAVQSMVNVKTIERLAEDVANAQAENARIKSSTGLLEEQKHQTVTRTSQMQSEMPEYRMREKQAEALLRIHPDLRDTLVQAGWISEKAANAISRGFDAVMPFVSGAKSALKYMHEWKGPPSTGLTPSQTRDLYNRFEAMRGN